MDSKISESFLWLIPITVVLLVNHYLNFFAYFGYDAPQWIGFVNDKINPHIHLVRGSFIIFIVAYSFANAKVNDKGHDNIAYLVLSIPLTFLFVRGFIPLNLYNLIGYPIITLASTITIMKTVQYFSTKKGAEGNLLSLDKTKRKSDIVLHTDGGPIYLDKPEYGMAIEGGAGSGKSVLIKNILTQCCNNGYAGVLYDFEGDCTEQDGAELTRTVLSALHNYNNTNRSMGRVGFAYLNFMDPSRTVRVNPLSPKYITREADLSEFAEALMTNLEPEWLKKKDFWASNAINYCEGILRRLYLDKDLHKYMSIPHLAMICTYDYEAVFRWMLENKSLENKIMPLYVAYKENATSQLAGAVSSAALPIAKLLQPDLFYPLSPETDEETFDLDITNEEHPVFFSIGTVPKYKNTLGPVCSLVMLVCMNNMNQFGKRKSLFVCDELPTIFIPNLDTLPATARKKKVATILAYQSFKQLENAYGKEKAEITRDNLSNQFLGKTRNTDSAERLSKYFGKEDTMKTGYSSSDSSETVSLNVQREEVLPADKILNQPIGHFTGLLASGKPPLFHAQFDYFEPKLMDIPHFSKKWFTESEELDTELMQNDVKENYLRIEREVNELLAKYDSI